MQSKGLPDWTTAPDELLQPIMEFFPADQWESATLISYLESGWKWDAVADTRDMEHPCGSVLRVQDGVKVAAEWSIGYFQINACNIPSDWNPAHLYNARQNVGTAHQLWAGAGGWSPWYFSAKRLGLIE